MLGSSREVLNEHLRKVNLGVKLSLSMGAWDCKKKVGPSGVVHSEITGA